MDNTPRLRALMDLEADLMLPVDAMTRVAAALNEWTGKRWLVSVSSHAGAPTLKQQAAAMAEAQRAEAAQHPLVKAVLQAFPGATIDEVRDLAGPVAPAAEAPEAAAEIGNADLPEIIDEDLS